MIPWLPTDLSVDPPSRQVASTDRLSLTFAAAETFTSATAKVVSLPRSLLRPEILESLGVDTVGMTATPLVSGFITGESYRLSVTFVRSDTTTWTRTLVLECVS